MRENSITFDLPTAANAPEGRRFGRTLFGYRRGMVDDAVTELAHRVEELEQQAVELREQLMETRQEADETQHDLTRSRAELRYWNDRASYVDSEVARARRVAADLERTARERAETIEADAQERSLTLVDRVCNEANAMLQHAREEAREMFLRFEQDVDLSHQKLEKLETVRREVAKTMQGALEQFEEAVRDLDAASPGHRIEADLERPKRTAKLTFGKQKAHEAAARFEAANAERLTAAMTSPVTPAPVAGEIDIDEIDGPGDTTDDMLVTTPGPNAADEVTDGDGEQPSAGSTVLTATVTDA